MPGSPARNSPRRRLFSHRRLLLGETVLVLGLVQMLGRDWMLAQVNMPAPVRVLLGMGLILGLFGGLLFFIKRQIQRSLSTTHDVMKRLPIPTPMLVIHSLAFTALFWAYAMYWNLDAEVWQAIVNGMHQARDWWLGTPK